MSVRLFVGNLPYSATESELREHFSEVGPVSFLSLPIDRETGQPRGFAFIEYHDSDQAEEAIRRFNDQLFQGRPIAVSVARAREDRPAGGGSSRPSLPRQGMNIAPEVNMPPGSGGKPSREFGPDASPQTQRNKKKKGPRQERGQKGPMREMVRGQFFGGDDETDDFDDDLFDFEDESDYPDPEESERTQELEQQDEVNLANRLIDLRGEESK